MIGKSEASPPLLYVLGHKNPDSDSICAAIGYAALLQAQGQAEARAARQGPIRRETAFVLDRFGLPSPLLVTDVRPRVADMMTVNPTCVHLDASLHEVGLTLQRHGIRTLPVVDDSGRLRGVTGVEDFATAFIRGLETDLLDHVPLNLPNLVHALQATVLVAAERPMNDEVMVGAMRVESMLRRIKPGVLLVMGDREDAQEAAIEVGVGALLITGGLPVSERIIELARQRQVTLISVPHHTHTTVRLIHLSVAVRHIMRSDPATCRPDDLIDEVRDTLRGGQVRSLVVIDERDHVAGLISRSNLLRPSRRRLVLVDHNERGQSVAGIEEAEIVGVIDHHRVADFQTSTPPYMRLEPVGSTSTIVAKLFAEAGQTIPPPVAGALLSGILADTLLFRGPTTTPEDRRIAAWLGEAANEDIQELGSRILELASDVSDRSAAQLLTGDFKELRVDGSQFGIGVIETTNAADVLARQGELLAEMSRLGERGYTSVLFAIIDILHERTTLLVAGHAAAIAEAFAVPLEEEHTLHLPGIISRKKNLVPMLGAIHKLIEKS
ncbi:MAG TPA: putative manganese-dependent inorganic diphosphatase [Chloroflexota bacterium]|nr:putative manganese-dependent inorganic diphosphatase [Chloroflexota bacterium]